MAVTEFLHFESESQIKENEYFFLREKVKLAGISITGNLRTTTSAITVNCQC